MTYRSRNGCWTATLVANYRDPGLRAGAVCLRVTMRGGTRSMLWTFTERELAERWRLE